MGTCTGRGQTRVPPAHHGSRDAESILEIVEAEQGELTEVNAASACSRLAKTHQSTRHGPCQDDRSVRQLLATVARVASSMNARAVANTLWAWQRSDGRLGRARCCVRRRGCSARAWHRAERTGGGEHSVGATLRWQAVNPLHEEMVSWHNAKSAFLPCTHTA